MRVFFSGTVSRIRNQKPLNRFKVPCRFVTFQSSLLSVPVPPPEGSVCSLRRVSVKALQSPTILINHIQYYPSSIRVKSMQLSANQRRKNINCYSFRKSFQRSVLKASWVTRNNFSQSRSELVGWRDRTMSSEHEKLACSKSPIHEESILKLSIDNTSLFAEESQQSGCSYRKVPIQESCLASKIWTCAPCRVLTFSPEE